jgi:hypothetical protein
VAPSRETLRKRRLAVPPGTHSAISGTDNFPARHGADVRSYAPCDDSVAMG